MIVLSSVAPVPQRPRETGALQVRFVRLQKRFHEHEAGGSIGNECAVLAGLELVLEVFGGLFLPFHKRVEPGLDL